MANVATPAFTGGFNDPVHGSQQGFRAIMEAMARPGTLQTPDGVTAPPPLNPVSALVALTLLDQDTSVWLDSGCHEQADVADWLSFHTGARITQNMATADFCILSNPKGVNVLADMALGSEEYPDRSATAIMQVTGFEANPDWVCEGPGIKGQIDFQPTGVDDSFLPVWSQNRAAFPRGVDLILASPTQLAALPRTTCIRKAREM